MQFIFQCFWRTEGYLLSLVNGPKATKIRQTYFCPQHNGMVYAEPITRSQATVHVVDPAMKTRNSEIPMRLA